MYILRHEFQVSLPWSHTHKQTFLHNLWVRGYRSLRSFHPKITNNWFLLCALQNLSWLFNNCARLLACKLSTPEIRETGPKYNLITCLNRFFQSFLSFSILCIMCVCFLQASNIMFFNGRDYVCLVLPHDEVQDIRASRRVQRQVHPLEGSCRTHPLRRSVIKFYSYMIF